MPQNSNRDPQGEDGDDRIRKVVVLGGGSAALLAAAAFAGHLPDIEVVMVRSTKIGIIGVGEGTIATIGRFLHDYLGIDPLRFHQEVLPSIKLGIQFDWGSETPYHYSFRRCGVFREPDPGRARPARRRSLWGDARFASLAASLMYHGNVTVAGPDGSPIQSPPVRHHLENRRFVEFPERWVAEHEIRAVDAIVEEVEIGQRGVESIRLDDGRTMTADLFVDCSGFRSELLGAALGEPFVDFKEALPCDRAVVGGWRRSDDTYHAFTTAQAMDSGWSWRIEHDDLVNRGYVFASDFISDDDAEAEFAANPKVTETRVIRFRSGYHRRSWVGNVVAIGNAAGFVERFQATGDRVHVDRHRSSSCPSARRARISDVQPRPLNRHQEANWLQTRDFLAMHYKVNRPSRSAFWDACRHDQPLGDAQDILDYYVAVPARTSRPTAEASNGCSGPRATSPSSSANGFPIDGSTNPARPRWRPIAGRQPARIGAGEESGCRTTSRAFVGAISVPDSPAGLIRGCLAERPTDSNPEETGPRREPRAVVSGSRGRS